MARISANGGHPENGRLVKRQNDRLRPGDLVEVKTPGEILTTLDADGSLDSLPFMPEMIEHCGRRFRVSNRAVKVCFTGKGSSPRRFRNYNVVLLEDLRCSGAAHDGCQKACMIFWRDAWLRKVADSESPAEIESASIERLRSRLKTSISPHRYYCQSSEILKATDHLSRWERYTTCVTEVRAGNCGAFQMLLRIGRFAFWKLRLKLIGDYRRGIKKTAEVLNLQPGVMVQVKSRNDIVDTLNEKGCHRGLLFMRGMQGQCGNQSRVKARIDQIIVDGTGEMRKLSDTVRLEGSVCGCTYQAIGGCSRREINYWREIWLRRI
jgi:hypothetical protein